MMLFFMGLTFVIVLFVLFYYWVFRAAKSLYLEARDGHQKRARERKQVSETKNIITEKE